MKSILILFSLFVFLIFEGCSDTTDTLIVPNNNIYQASGTVTPTKPLANNARVVAVWGVKTATGEKNYVVGTGTVNTGNNTFILNFTSNPPENVLTDSQFGLARILVTTDQNIKDGDEFTKDDISNIAGGAPDYAFIYIKGDPAAITYNNWLKQFKTGFNTGKGIRYDSKLDEFELTTPNSIEIIIDDIKNLKFINWT